MSWGTYPVCVNGDVSGDTFWGVMGDVGAMRSVCQEIRPRDTGP